MATNDELDVQVDIKDFTQQLKKLGAEMEQKVVASAVSAAAEVFKKAIVRLAPKAERGRGGKYPRVAGLLKRAVYKYRKRDPKTGTVAMVVSFRKGKGAQRLKRGSLDAWYARFLEFGWIPRGPGAKFKGGKRRVLFQRSAYTALGGRTVTKYKFIGPGYAKAKSDALTAFTARMDKRIDALNFVGPQLPSAASQRASFVGPVRPR